MSYADLQDDVEEVEQNSCIVLNAESALMEVLDIRQGLRQERDQW